MAARSRATERTPLVPDDVEIIPDERVEILDAKTDEPKFGDAKREGAIDVMAIITKALTAGGIDEAAGVTKVIPLIPAKAGIQAG